MFDELDDPNAPRPDAAARAAVGARVTRLRRRRGAAWGGGAGAALLAVAAIVYAGAEPRALDSVVTETTSPAPTEDAPSPPATPEPTPTGTPEPTPTPTPRRTGAPGPSPTAEPEPPAPPPTPSATTSPLPFDQTPDGKPGWHTGMVGCGNVSTLPEEGTAPFPGLTLTLDLPGTTFVSGRSYPARLLVENTGDVTVRFGAWVPGGTYALDDRGNGSAAKGNDAYVTHRVELDPGEVHTFDTHVVTSGCGDAPGDEEVPLPAGTYRMTYGMRWSDRSSWTGPSPEPSPSETSDPGHGEWYVAPMTVRMTESG